MPLIKNGARVRQIVTPIEGPVMSKQVVDDKVTYIVMNEATGHEVALDEECLELVEESNDTPAEPAAT